jgi:hypothetical protein
VLMMRRKKGISEGVAAWIQFLTCDRTTHRGAWRSRRSAT